MGTVEERHGETGGVAGSAPLALKFEGIVIPREGESGQVSGPQPDRQSPLLARLDATTTSFNSAGDAAAKWGSALTECMVRDQTGQKLPA
jgi:hypothetical protein